MKRRISFAGFELGRRIPDRTDMTSGRRCASSGVVVEFLGPRGVGKTTLNSRIFKIFRKKWYFRDDLEKIRPIENCNPEFEKLLWRIFSLRLENLKKANTSDFTKIKSANHDIKAIYQSLIINGHDFVRGFILDEGLFKKFYPEILDLGFSDTSILWRNRAFIYIRPVDLDLIWDRYSERDQFIKHRNRNHKSLSKKDVFERANQEMKLLDRLYERTISENIYSLKICPEDGYEKNISEIIGFEAKVTSSNKDDLVKRISPNT